MTINILYRFVLICSVLTLFSCNSSKTDKELNPSLMLWYDKPASSWTEALPVGNGRLGAMVFSNPETERIQLNEESLWAGCKTDNNNPKSLANLEKIQQLIFDGEYKEASRMASECMVGTPPQIRSYQTLGDLIVDYQWESEAKNYRRELDLNTGIATTTFEIGDNRVKQEVFASAPHELIVVQISATKPIDLDVRLKREKDAGVHATSDGIIIMTGQIIDEENPKKAEAGAHMKFSAMASLKNKEGELKKSDEGISCNAVRAITIYLTAATNYDIEILDTSDEIDPLAKCKKKLNEIGNQSFAEIKEVHVLDHANMFSRVDLSFGKDTLTHLPTDQRLNRIKEGAIDNGLIATYFQYGRYLLMGSSRHPGRLPANLQGVWNDKFKAPWNSDFHTNINLQMNYWPAEVCNLSESSLILANFMEKLTVPGAVTARKMYGANGWTMHHLTDVYGRTGVADGVWGVSPLAGPWMTFTIYRHYEFTQDTAYLKSIYPIIKGAAEFVIDFLVESPEGYLVTNPSQSPENMFFAPGSNKKERSALTYASTIDVQIINKLFDVVTATSRILDSDHAFSEKIESIRKQLPPVQIGENGTIQEWINDYEEVKIGHRHISHLLGLYPLAQITSESPKLFEAARKTIERRLSAGGGHTGWSRAWIVNFYARIQNGEEAWSHLQLLLAKSTLPNLFDTHPPFQIDGNFGGTAGIAEMLLQSHLKDENGDYFQDILPALPSALSSGEIYGIKGRGNFEISIEWQNKELVSVEVKSLAGNKLNLRYKGSLISQETTKGETFSFVFGDFK